MVNVEKINGENDFLQCASCMKSSEETDVYKVEVGKTSFATSMIKLCYNCLIDLGNQINDINHGTSKK